VLGAGLKASIFRTPFRLTNSNRSADFVELLPYQRALRDFLKTADPAVWDWFARERRSAKHADNVRFELLKSTYRLERETQPGLYDAAEEVAAAFQITAPLTIYQAQSPEGHNASLAYVSGEVHLVLHGPICERLTPLETRGLVGHELGHYCLWSGWNGELLATADMLLAYLNDPHVHPAHLASHRLFQLYNEIYCDRCALLATGDVNTVVAMLVKVTSGVGDVSAEAYLRQAEEIFARADASTEGLTHPEAFIRARAVHLWAEQGVACNETIARMIEGRPGIDALDLLEQTRVARCTRQIFDLLLRHPWFRTELVLAHAQLFFPDYEPTRKPIDEGQLAREIRVEPDSLRDYYCFILLDLLSADRDQDEPAVAAVLLVAERIGVKSRFIELSRQELKLRKTQLERVDRLKEQIVSDADRAAVEAP